MPFNYILTNLLVDVPGAVGAIFVDPEGEAVDWVTRHDDPYDLKVEGAYHSIFKRRIEETTAGAGMGAVTGYVVEGSELIALTESLLDGYYVVLVMHRSGPLGRARHHLRRASKVIARELE
jgi:hypothetical protein